MRYSTAFCEDCHVLKWQNLKMLKLLLLAFTIVVFQVSACDFPNGTETALHWWQCGGAEYVRFTDAIAVDASGNQEYPIRLTEVLYVKSHAINNLAVLSNPNVIESSKVYQYTKSWSGSACQWQEVPTFGLFENINACEKGGVTCPVGMGEQTVLMKMDFTAFNFVINGLPNDVPYMMQITINDKKTGKSACIMAQARALTKK